MQNRRSLGKPIDGRGKRLYAAAMKSREIAMLFLTLIVLLALAQFFYFFGDLPTRVATRFDAAGQPELHLHKAAFVAFYLGVVVFFSVYGYLARFHVHRLSDRYLKIIPNHAHWLAPERREESLAWVSGALVWVAVFTLGLFAATFTIIMLANTGQTLSGMSGMSGMSTLLTFMNTVYLTLLFILVLAFRKRYHLK